MNCLHNRHFMRKMFFHSVTHTARKKSLQHTYVQHAIIHLREFYVQITRLEIHKRSFSRLSAKLWNEIPCSSGNLPKKEFKREIRRLLLDILVKENNYLETRIVIHNQEKMAEKWRVCMAIQSQLILAK